MEALLNDVEVRVLGSLIEKQLATPDYYPLTLNALINACNQLSNREPVASYDEGTVELAVESLRARNLVYVFYGSESRVPKYKHVATEIFHLSSAELAVMCVLLLRGPQTIGEIRGRTGRLYVFTELSDVETTLDGLARREEPLVVKLPRQSGRKEARYAHLLSGAPVIDETGEEPRAAVAHSSTSDRVSRLESQVESLRAEVVEIRKQFDEFRKQFE